MVELPLSQTASAIRASVFADLAPRIEARARRGGDMVELHLGDTCVAPPEGARFALVEGGGFDTALYRYGPVAGVDALKEAFAGRLRARGFGPPGVGASHVLVAAGATHAIFCGLRAVLEPGDGVLVAAPYWPLAVGVVRAAGGVPVEVPLTTRLYEDPSLDPAVVLEEALRRHPRGVRALYLITPNNPDGKVYSPAQLASIARFAVAHDLWVLADEVYLDFVYEGVHASIASFEGMAERTLSAYSLSKSHGLAGGRASAFSSRPSGSSRSRGAFRPTRSSMCRSRRNVSRSRRSPGAPVAVTASVPVPFSVTTRTPGRTTSSAGTARHARRRCALSTP